MGKTNSKQYPKEFADLKEQTEFTTQEIKLWYKGFLKDYPSGYFGIQEFKYVYKRFFPYGDADEFAKHAFRVFDKNNDGKIDFREFITALSVTARGTIEQKLEWIFSMYDFDGNGYISRDEMMEVVSAIYKMVADIGGHLGECDASQRVDQIYAKMDKNTDGNLSLNEFIEGGISDAGLMKILQGDISSMNG